MRPKMIWLMSMSHELLMLQRKLTKLLFNYDTLPKKIKYIKIIPYVCFRHKYVNIMTCILILCISVLCVNCMY